MTDNFVITVDDDQNLCIKCSNRDFDIIDLIDALSDIDLDWYVSNIDGWSYLYDVLEDTVYWIDDYMFNKFHELRESGEAILPPHKNVYSNYAEYEWNYERLWTEEEMKL